MKRRCFFYLACLMTAACTNFNKVTEKNLYTEVQLTKGEEGHCLNSTQCFSPDDQWIVFDTRNHDTLIRSTGRIRMVHVASGEIKDLYQTQNQTEFGPGVGAATFSPADNRVLFIHGIRNAGAARPYDLTRRTGVAVDVERPGEPLFLDARDITPPFTPGALRGGTHAHTWSGDGKWISFTYNDFVIEQAAKAGNDLKDLRTVGVMAPLGRVAVSDDGSQENNSGLLFSAVVARVTENPAPGSDEIEKAFDECWIGKNGYRKTNGEWQLRALAFQGHVRRQDGSLHTEVFVTDLPEDLRQPGAEGPLEGTATRRPGVPAGVKQRRITFTEQGIQGPRHWLRSTSDGSLIGFLSKDTEGHIQVFGVSPNGGVPRQLTSNDFSVQGPFNFHGPYVAYAADNSVFITHMETGETKRLTPRFSDEEKPAGAVVWSNNGKTLAYNRYVSSSGGNFLQIFLIHL